MDEQGRSGAPREEPERGNGEQPTPRWTFWEILGLLISAILVAAPLLSLGYAFVFPESAPAQERADTPTPGPTDTPRPETSTPTSTPTNTPTTTPTDAPTVATATAGPTQTAAPGPLFVGKVANRNQALLGEQIVFSIGLTNGRYEAVLFTVSDTLPDRLDLVNVSHTCTGGTVAVNGRHFDATDLGVAAQQSCQIIAVAVVTETCDCYVVNRADWWGDGESGTANSQQILLVSSATPTPTPTRTAPPMPTAGPTNTPNPTVAGTPTSSPARTPSAPSPPTPTFTPSPPTPTFTPSPPTPTFTPSPPTPTFTPSPATAEPTRTRRPTRRQGQPTQPPEPTSSPTPMCAQARVMGDVCAANVAVTISSCCPVWSAQTTTDAAGRFEFAALTPGTYTVSAQGRSRVAVLPECDSSAQVNLCPVPAGTAVPTVATVPVTVTATVTQTAVLTATVTPTPTPREAATLSLEVSPSTVEPGGALTFILTLQNRQRDNSIDDVVIQGVFSDALSLQGAAAAAGVVRVSGQVVSLELDRLGAGQTLRLQVDASVRSKVPVGTILEQQGTAQSAGAEKVFSNLVRIEVIGEAGAAVGEPTAPGVEPTLAPDVAPTVPGLQPTAVGGPEGPAPAIPPAGPGELGSEIPYTGAGLPVAGVVLGGVVLVARQMRLRWAGRRQED